MLLVIREYLSMLKESGELDVLLPDILLSMKIVPTGKPTIGVRQHGVDLEAVGIDPVDSKQKVFLFVIKQGNLDRTNWNSGPQAVKQSIDEILNVYLTSIIDKRYKTYIKKIVVCTNGEFNQTIKLEWEGYCKANHKKKIEFDFWGADNLTQLINTNLLSEYLFPIIAQKQMRKTLALIDDPDYELYDFFSLIEDLLFNKPPNKNKIVKTLRLINLCLNILFHWSKELGNIKSAFFASERVVLKIWKWLNVDPKRKSEVILAEISKINITRIKIWLSYYTKVFPHFNIRDGLYGYGDGAEKLEYNLLVFEQIGIISLIGLDYYYHSLISRQENDYKSAQIVANSLGNLIKNNTISNQPVFDGHINQISLALLLLCNTKNDQFAKLWIKQIAENIVLKYRMKKFFPIFNDSYETLVDVELEIENCEVNSSTLIYILLEWCIVLNDEELYNYIYKMFYDNFPNIDLQIWYPNTEVEKSLYDQNALHANGTIFSLRLKNVQIFNDFKKLINDHLEKEENPKDLTFIKEGFFSIGLIASRHYGTQILPFYWRTLIEQNKS